MTVFVRKPPIWYYAAGVFAALWGAMGCYACYLQVTLGADGMSGATAYDRALYATLPGWYNAVYAVAVGTGLLGGIALLARRRIARPLFLISLIAVVVQFGYLFLSSDIVAVKGPLTAFPFPILISLIGCAELWLTRYAQERGWIF